MKLRRYQPHPAWYSKTIRRLGIFWGIVIGFPLIFYLFSRVVSYIAAFGVVVLIYWLIYTAVTRRK